MSMTLSEDQKKVFDKLLHFFFECEDTRELTLGGLAGTGKSTLIAELLSHPEIRNLPHRDVHIATYTGKAAERLMRTPLNSLGFPITTMHKLLFTFRRDPITKELETEERTDLPKFVIIDEASMVPEDFYKCLLEPHKGVKKVLFVGDHGQLPPISKKGETAFNLMEDPMLKLEKVHRQVEGSAILSTAQEVRKARSVFEIKKSIRESTLPKVDAETAIRYSTQLARQTSWDDVVHLVFTNNTRGEINQRLLATHNGEHGSFIGAPIICLKNKVFSESAMLANGSRGILSFIDVDSHNIFRLISAKFPILGQLNSIKSLKKSWLNPSYTHTARYSDILPFDFAFAVTCHKAQGCGWPHVFIWLRDLDNVRDTDFLKRWLYTAITRAEDNITFVI